jgi:hypothetical protein
MSELITINGADIVSGSLGGVIDGTDLYPNGFATIGGVFNGKVTYLPDNSDTDLSDYDIEVIAKRAVGMMVIIDNLESDNARELLSANMGRVLNEELQAHATNGEIHVTQSQKDKWEKVYEDFYSIYEENKNGVVDKIQEVLKVFEDFPSDTNLASTIEYIVEELLCLNQTIGDIKSNITNIKTTLDGKVNISDWSDKNFEIEQKIEAVDSKGVALGETSDTAYAGNKGKELADRVDAIDALLEDGVGKIQGITVNGEEAEIDDDGIVNIKFNSVEIDDSLDTESTNAIQNSVVATKFEQIEANTLEGSDVEIDEENNLVTVKLMGKKDVITEFTIPAGSGGGGGGESTTAKVVLNASVSKSIIKEGGSSVLTYFYDHQYSSGEDAGMSTGQKGTISIEVKLGTLVLYSETLTDVAAGTYTLDLTKYLSVGTVEIYLKATALNPLTDKTQSKQSYVTIKVLQLDLSTTYNIYNSVADGGYANDATMTIPYTIKGSGSKLITLSVDGKQYDTAQVNRSGTTNGSFSVSMNGLTIGKHTAFMQAAVEQGTSDELLSDGIYIEFFKTGLSTPLIAYMMSGESQTEASKIFVEQYQQYSFDYAVYDPNNVTATLYIDDKSLSVSRRKQSYSGRSKTAGDFTIVFKCEDYSSNVYLAVEASSVDIVDTTYGITLDLNAEGRSNSEATKNTWVYNGYECKFSGFDWSSDGWDGESITIKNGASIEIPYYVFAKDASTSGATIELEYMTSNASDKDEALISCYANNVGFEVTAEKASLYSGSTKEVEDDDGNKTVQPVGVGRQYGEDEWNRATFVLGKKTEGRLMELYVNGYRVAADVYNSSDIFQIEDNEPIRITASKANLKVRNVRVYERPLSDREVLDNYIYSRTDTEEMINLYNENNINNDDETVSFEALRAQGKSVIRFIRAGGLEPVNAENNKKTDFLCDVIQIWMPDGRYIELRNVNIRIQGTSSTKYPSKNYRIYVAKGQEPELWIDGELQDVNAFALLDGQPLATVFCAKADYSDASMTQNTGGALLWDKVCKALKWTTPAQKRDKNKRNAIYGFPVDVFASETEIDTPVYYGQYNLNNDKSDWYDLLGLTDEENELPIALEMLNNMQPLCLFQSELGLSDQFNAQFEDALEFNYPKDMTWADVDEDRRNAILRFWGWIRDCAPTEPDYDNLSTFISQKFKDEYKDYIDPNLTLGWYCFTELHGMVDQRVKNTIWHTFDGKIWGVFYYDGDTQMGDRNDSMLAYDYLMSRDTWDSEKSKYAFEGHDSVLWCLILANLEDELKDKMDTLRTQLSKELVYQIFEEQISDNWCATTYNKSGEMKYIKPQTEGVTINGNVVKYPYIYALKGDKKAFRHWYLDNRYMYIDAKYNTAAFRSDNIDMYLTRKATDTMDFLRITASERYFFGYGTNNAPYLFPAVEADTDEVVTMSFSAAYTVNDPIRVYGASRIKILDLTDLADIITGDINLNKCTALEEIDASTDAVGGVYSSGWCLVLDNCSKLTRVNLNGQRNAKTGTLSSTELNFEGQSRLQYLDARGTNVQSVVLAAGCQIKEMHLGSNIKTLTLNTLPNLKTEDLTLENWDTVEVIKIANCPRIDIEAIIAKCPNLKRIRLENVDLYGDGSFLEKYKNLGGLDEDGSAVSYPAITGSYEFNYNLSDDEIAEYQEFYKELNIYNSKYSCYSISTNTTSSFSVSNHDNKTGYLYGNTYVASGHSERIWDGSPMGAVTYSRTRKTCTFQELNDDLLTYKSSGEAYNSDKELYKIIPTYWYKGVENILENRQNIYIAYKKPSDPNRALANEMDGTIISKETGVIIYADEDDINSFTMDDYTRYENKSYDTFVLNVDGVDYVRLDVDNSQEITGCAFFGDDDTCIGYQGMNASYNFDGIEYIVFTVPSSATKALLSSVKGKNIYLCVGHTDECVEEWIERKQFLIGQRPNWDYKELPNLLPKATKNSSEQQTQTDRYKMANWVLDETMTPTTTTFPTDANLFQLVNWYYMCRAKGQGWNMVGYEEYKDLIILLMCYSGSVSGKAFFTTSKQGTNTTLPPNNFTSNVNDKKDNYTCFKGIRDFPAKNSFVDGLLFGVSSYNKAEKNSFNVPLTDREDDWDKIVIKDFKNGTERILNTRLSSSAKANSYSFAFNTSYINKALLHIRFGKHCDIIPRGTTTTDFSLGLRTGMIQTNSGSADFINVMTMIFQGDGYYQHNFNNSSDRDMIGGQLLSLGEMPWAGHRLQCFGYNVCYYGDFEIK